ncbi:MAG TPA: CATRA conflict system CASPASE/TPR repeat-associated protein [Streptosporangiaceae bacterium]|nr:CATRA conflict system CASPASE/TPR repeat-associated protein [Streptosporangiaceae bacterium]
MTESVLIDQELVVHIFAELNGPRTTIAKAQLHAIWSRCRDLLCTTEPITWTKLPPSWPSDLRADSSADKALAGLQGRTQDCQVVVRQLGDVLGLSIILATPADTSLRERRIGSAAPAGWIEFDRWWGELAAEGTDELLGVVRVYQAKHNKEAPPLSVLAAAVRAEVPQADTEPGWWDYGEFRPEGFTIWELCSPKDTRPERQLVVIAPLDRNKQLCAWTWSPRGVAVPPLARYLSHAARIRSEARTWHPRRSNVDQLRHEADDRLRQLQADLNQPVILDKLAHDEAKLVVAGTTLQERRLATTIGSANMSAALTEPLPGDRGLVDWLVRELGDTATYLNITLQRVREVRDIAPMPLRSAPPSPTVDALRLPNHQQQLPSTIKPQVNTSPTAVTPATRIGFALDIARYRERSASERDYVQQRLAVLIDDVLDDLGVRLADTDHQGRGAGLDIFLPTLMQSADTLPILLHSLRVRLERSNRRFADRMRLRLAAGSGTTGVAALGLAGASVNDVRRLVNSTVLRRAMENNREADLVALISDDLYSCLTGHDAVNKDIKLRCEKVHIKLLASNAWLWVARE